MLKAYLVELEYYRSGCFDSAHYLSSYTPLLMYSLNQHLVVHRNSVNHHLLKRRCHPPMTLLATTPGFRF